MIMDQNIEHKNKTILGFIWRFLHNFGVQVISLAIQIVIARILLPEAYGIIALTSIFTAIGMVFIHGAFSASIIQKKEISQLELSSIFYLGIMISVIFIGIITFISPMVANFYNEPILINVLRIQSLTILIGSTYTVHQSLMFRQMEYKKGFIAGMIGVSVQGVIGIYLAMSGFGVWALVYSLLANQIITALTIILLIRWKPSKAFSFTHLIQLFSYSSRIFVINLMNAIYTNVIFLFIGKIYDSETLGYYHKGYGFPTLIMNNFDGAMNNVLFSSLSRIQERKEESLNVLRRSMKISMYISAPAMLGLVVVAEPLVSFLLTDKWLPSVPFLQIVALGCLIWPLSARIQAINAIGRSDVSLRINILLRIIGIVLLVIFSRYNIYLLVLSTIIGELLIAFLTSFVVKNMLGYTLKKQALDIFPNIFLAAVMAALIWPVLLLGLSSFVTLLIQMSLGLIIYILLSYVFKIESFTYLVNQMKTYIRDLKQKR